MAKEKLIAVGTQCIDEKDVAYVSAMLQDPFLTQGPQLKAFEKSICDFTGAAYASAVSSGSAALHIACKIFKCDEQTELFSPPITFASSQNAALHFGAKICFVDVDQFNGNMSVEALEQALQNSKAKNKIIMPVHFAGLACDMDDIHDLAQKYGASIIEDASHALGAKYKDKYIGNTHDNHMVVLSFHPLKHITTGEGGAILCNDQNFKRLSDLYRSHGIDKSNQTIADQKNKLWHYEMTALGFNYRMSDINAALGVSQMRKLQSFLNRRKMMAQKYTKAFRSIDVTLQCQENDKEHAWLLYMLQIDFEKKGLDKNNLMLDLRKQGVATQVHNIPVYRHPYFVEGYGDLRHQFPNCEKFFAQTFSIPLHPKMTEQDQAKVIEVISKTLD